MTRKSTILNLPTPDSTYRLGFCLGETLKPGSLLLLKGDLGAGKTTLVQGLAEGLGIADLVVSPTFTLISEYTDGRIPLYHFDLYRLAEGEAASLYPEIYWEGVEVTPGIVAIEWAERLLYKPAQYLEVCLTDLGDCGRQAELLPVGGFDLKNLVF
ncbi:tRNA (adenosine(37)-N6)-threonylcarbamoyltransferase complex ATPase subunit type 1 TsaE [Ancylothrix sp. C2]|uniref:tRNA (adenosine(37)-N6)-threonylcarbamoyltransferase complex ATPase subunit type 1 TsaE n=1 Tax=Ancylothrix sp. D3o TaxID=2953691 RepID=UPI0021BBB18B|nr:tRNA (adenosine(37)-N6)-threonylcarbamoyltransferase complex ATPase subunit type 1 TsaE [Ancylothrix sp. D3o]MCT7950465.1 tRNA (adenosine(37)-N6)-threonylcarbamoyltransferase complex ATPase subunit type 1 TsaE [Ancylothrix sp. D3o]